MPNLTTLYGNEYGNYLNEKEEDSQMVEEGFQFEVKVETNVRQVYRYVSCLRGITVHVI